MRVLYFIGTNPRLHCETMKVLNDKVTLESRTHVHLQLNEQHVTEKMIVYIMNFGKKVIKV